jgi:hypothetical protein
MVAAPRLKRCNAYATALLRALPRRSQRPLQRPHTDCITTKASWLINREAVGQTCLGGNMYRFTFNRGTWENSNSLPEWGDNEDFHAYLERIGYVSRSGFYGDEHGGNIEIYESSDADSFYASVCPSGGTVYEVFLPDFPSLMMFIRDHATVFSAESANSSQQEILKLLEKLFLLQHGHAATSICAQCDPAGWEAMARLRKAKNTAP